MESFGTGIDATKRSAECGIKDKGFLFCLTPRSCMMAVEIKNFVSASKISEFHMALGQFINYRTALRVEEPNRTLYLAVPLVS
jgi:XisH protein